MISKSDIKTFEELLAKLKEKLSKEELKDIKVQELLMFTDNSIKNLKESYKEQNINNYFKNKKLVHKHEVCT